MTGAVAPGRLAARAKATAKRSRHACVFACARASGWPHTQNHTEQDRIEQYIQLITNREKDEVARKQKEGGWVGGLNITLRLRNVHIFIMITDADAPLE